MDKLKAYLKPRGRASWLADQLGLRPTIISMWANGKQPVSAARCIDIEAITDGEILCEDLRPDLDWQTLRKHARTMPQFETTPAEK